MSKRDELIAKYANDIKENLNVTLDMELLTKVTIGCGPAIYKADAEIVAASSKEEKETIKNNFLKKKLDLVESPKLMEGIEKIMEQYGKSNRNKYRPVVYYLLTRHFKKEAVYA